MGTLSTSEERVGQAGASGCAPCLTAELRKALNDVEYEHLQDELDRLAEVVQKGAENASPADRARLRGLLAYYRKKRHPFGACVRDNTKRFGKEGAERVCATLKDIMEGNPYWRNKPGPGR